MISIPSRVLDCIIDARPDCREAVEALRSAEDQGNEQLVRLCEYELARRYTGGTAVGLAPIDVYYLSSCVQQGRLYSEDAAGTVITEVAALLLGVSPARVRQLCMDERLDYQSGDARTPSRISLASLADYQPKRAGRPPLHRHN